MVFAQLLVVSSSVVLLGLLVLCSAAVGIRLRVVFLGSVASLSYVNVICCLVSRLQEHNLLLSLDREFILSLGVFWCSVYMRHHFCSFCFRPFLAACGVGANKF